MRKVLDYIHLQVEKYFCTHSESRAEYIFGSTERTVKERRDACKILENLAASLGSIRSQAIFKRVGLVGWS